MGIPKLDEGASSAWPRGAVVGQKRAMVAGEQSREDEDGRAR